MEKVTHNNVPEAVEILMNKFDTLINHLNKIGVVGATDEQPVKDFMDFKEACAFLGYAESTMYGKVSRNEIPYYKPANKLFFSKAELTQYLKHGRPKTVTENKDEAIKLFQQINQRA